MCGIAALTRPVDVRHSAGSEPGMAGSGGTRRLRITFGMIVLNGKPFIRYNLRSLYPWAHQIIVVEGACPTATEVATPDGHSLDGTLDELRRMQREEDPERKLTIVTAIDEGHNDGFWTEKDEMSAAYARRATGDYLWQVDSDEFYLDDHIARLIDILDRERPDAVSFPMITFWGSISYITNSFDLISGYAREYHRLFAWGSGYTYSTHRPPTVLDERGVNTRTKCWLRARDIERRGIFLYHYCLLFPMQVFNKISYYKRRVPYAIDYWQESVYRRLERPFHTHVVCRSVGWLERYHGPHPAQVLIMMDDIAAGRLAVELRDCRDVERLLSRWWYRVATILLRRFALLLACPPFHSGYRLYVSCVTRIGMIGARRCPQRTLN